MRVRKRLHQNGLDQRKDRRVGAYAKGEGRDGGEGKDGRFCEQSNGISNVCEDVHEALDEQVLDCVAF